MWIQAATEVARVGPSAMMWNGLWNVGVGCSLVIQWRNLQSSLTTRSNPILPVDKLNPKVLQLEVGQVACGRALRVRLSSQNVSCTPKQPDPRRLHRPSCVDFDLSLSHVFSHDT